MRRKHSVAHATCPYGADNWARCDKYRDVEYLNWCAMQQVILAARVVDAGETKPYRKDKGIFAQLVQWLNGDREDIMNDDGNPNEGAFVVRLRAARARYLAGDLPRYNLYTPPSGGI